MHNEFTAIIEKDGEWFIGYCPEIPGANGQGKTMKECRSSLTEAIALILEDRRQDSRDHSVVSLTLLYIWRLSAACFFRAA